MPPRFSNLPHGQESGGQSSAGGTPALRSSALLDTHVVYYGDNLEQLGQMQNEEGRMMKPARSPILHLSFILLTSPLHASHYVKVMLDQIFGENN
jgi:hypothetical protein